jgi:3-methyladenine DNA glycosylase/8-oxoguanine DNA glycosylase
MIEWFNSRQALERGVALADKLTPAVRTDKPEAVLSANKLEHIVGLAAAQTNGLTLNFYQRARLANAFKWRLIENGVGRQVADEVTQALVVNMAMSRKRLPKTPV